jgi:hypothetical protein
MRITDRKARLFASGCCRRLWSLVDAPHCRRLLQIDEGLHSVRNMQRDQPSPISCHQAIELAERSADEVVAPDELKFLSESALSFSFIAEDYCACYDESVGPFDAEAVATGEAASAVYHACKYYGSSVDAFGRATGAFDCLWGVVWDAALAVAYLRSTGYGGANAGGDPHERAMHCALLRDIVGNPYRPATLDPAWLTPKVTALATSIYNDRAFDRMPILADALEDAGCDNSHVLEHCRGPGLHCRGCWVVDLILDKC